jgi:Pyruvate/2-oxoacid:ferredoxin oxidoreductase gamma subunit
MKRIAFSGVGGQSVRLVSHTLALALKELGYHVTLLLDYVVDPKSTDYGLPHLR